MYVFVKAPKDKSYFIKFDQAWFDKTVIGWVVGD
jgi:hypothetical protein